MLRTAKVLISAWAMLLGAVTFAGDSVGESWTGGLYDRRVQPVGDVELVVFPSDGVAKLTVSEDVVDGVTQDVLESKDFVVLTKANPKAGVMTGVFQKGHQTVGFVGKRWENGVRGDLLVPTEGHVITRADLNQIIETNGRRPEHVKFAAGVILTRAN